VEPFRAHPHDSQVHRDPIARTQFPNEVRVVLQIHRARLTQPVIRVAESHGRIKRISCIVKDGDVVADVHVFIAIGPLIASYRLETGRRELPNLLESKWRRSHFYNNSRTTVGR